MPMPNAQQAAANWSRGMSNSTEKIRAGINAVTESPTAKAAQATDRYLQGVQQSVASGKLAASLNRVTLQDWKTAAIEKGVNRIAAGAAAAQSKFASFMNEFLPYLQAGVAQLPPRGTVDQNIERAVQMMRYNSKFRKSA